MNKLIFLLCLVSGVYAQADMSSVVGRWKTIDDETKKERSIVEISQQDQNFSGKVVEILNPDRPSDLCDKCPGDKKDKPIKGLEILWGMKETQKGQMWEDGHILDPNNGKTYKCRLRLLNDGKKLEVRGFIGFSLIGRSQVWLREP